MKDEREPQSADEAIRRLEEPLRPRSGVLAFMLGLASFGSGAAAGASLSRRQAAGTSASRKARLGLSGNLAVLVVYAGPVVGGWLGWLAESNGIGILVGALLGLGATYLVIGLGAVALWAWKRIRRGTWKIRT